jgi:hypothetical protein
MECGGWKYMYFPQKEDIFCPSFPPIGWGTEWGNILEKAKLTAEGAWFTDSQGLLSQPVGNQKPQSDKVAVA